MRDRSRNWRPSHAKRNDRPFGLRRVCDRRELDRRPATTSGGGTRRRASARSSCRTLSSSPVSDNEIAGLPTGSQPEVLTWDRIYALALVRARTRRGAFSPTLDPAALAEEAARQGIADFARFRTNFHSDGPFHDPGLAVLELQGRLLAIDNERRNIAVHEALNKLIVERSQGNTSGVTRIDVDTVFASLLRARQKLADETRQFRDGLDQLKFLLGLSPRAAVILDRQNLQAFPAVFEIGGGLGQRPQEKNR